MECFASSDKADYYPEYISCGKLAKKCLDEGGCARTCRIPESELSPNTNEFFGTGDHKDQPDQIKLQDLYDYSIIKLGYYPVLEHRL